MKHIDPKATVRPTPEAKGYLDVLKKNGAFGRAIERTWEGKTGLQIQDDIRRIIS